jgi:hypothetical protein
LFNRALKCIERTAKTGCTYQRPPVEFEALCDATEELESVTALSHSGWYKDWGLRPEEVWWMRSRK